MIYLIKLTKIVRFYIYQGNVHFDVILWKNIHSVFCKKMEI